MPGRIILTLAAAVLFIAGGAALFAPDELARALDPGGSPRLALVVQLLGGALLAVALMDWMSRGNRIGGIYGRPLGMGNLLLFATAALALGKAAAADHLPAAAIALSVLFAGLALGFAWLVFAHDPLTDAATESAGLRRS